ncbi:glycosyltransferase family 2 protein [Pseudomonas sp. S1Bt23]|uniref:glycosyltransferase family 2 protein n=1 Tax=Pseudomonas sp. S1Bt23 TaxID=3095074 RepID=UPI002A5A330D|nr:glycosyltransferase family 2 protein [Pseudomonas sp. S1Bt23]WPO45825.1 glycosyltransferase family 2 protein [Pseudomonas sp. S1Bt23]
MSQRQSLGVLVRRFFHIKLGVLQQHAGELITPSFYSVGSVKCQSMPLISIVIPSFNQGQYIGRTLRSILSQSYSNIEIIVQDNCSTDNTSDVVASFASDKISFHSEKDKGQADAINRGFQRSSGEILYYLNSDDMLLPNSLEFIVREFEGGPYIDCIYGNRLIIDEWDRLVGRWVLPYHDENLLHAIDYIPQETLFWRRSLWTRVGGRVDDTLSFALDWDMLLCFVKNNAHFRHVPYFLGAFRIHSDQKTTSQYEQTGRAEMMKIRARYPRGLLSRWLMPIRHLCFLLSHIRADKKLMNNVAD